MAVKETDKVCLRCGREASENLSSCQCGGDYFISCKDLKALLNLGVSEEEIFLMKHKENEMCMACRKERIDVLPYCVFCGCRYFISGKNFDYDKETGVQCHCGSRHFQRIPTTLYHRSYRCEKCGNIITVSVY